MRIAVVLAVAVLGTACGVADPPRQAACGPVEHPEIQDGGHLLGDAEPPVPYSSTPGTSGWHISGSPRTGVVDEPLPEPEIVAALERGQAVAAYDPDSLPAEDVDALEALATGRLEGRLTVTPFHGDMGAPLVLNGWGVRQPCERVDETSIVGFVAEHPEPVGH